MNYKKFKSEILIRAKKSEACQDQYKRAYAAEYWAELFQVIKDNWNYACNNGVVDVELLASVKDEAAECEVWCNESVTTGYLLVDNATVRASGNATVMASDNATVEAWGNATVRAWGNATVRASDNATVRASGNATVRASDNATVEAWGNATVRASGNATVMASDNATAEAWDSAFIRAYSTMQCKLSNKAIAYLSDTNEVVIVMGAMKVREVEP